MAGADGMLTFTPAVPFAEPPPRLCASGPCRHYHRMVVQLDAANPRPERRGGVLVQHARTFHVQVSHYCYPDTGIETTLGDVPVLECNRWVPEIGLLRRLTGGEGRLRRRYERDLAAWHDAKERADRELAEAAGALGEAARVTVAFEISSPSGETFVGDVDVDGYGDSTIADLVNAAVRQTPIQLEQHRYTVAVGDLESVVDNHDATLDELGAMTTADGVPPSALLYVMLHPLSKE